MAPSISASPPISTGGNTPGIAVLARNRLDRRAAGETNRLPLLIGRHDVQRKRCFLEAPVRQVALDQAAQPDRINEISRMPE
jgi:hypothetical protein